MSPAEFLRAVWPSDGIYCLAVRRPTGGWKHTTYDPVDEAAAAAVLIRGDLFFNIHTLKEKNVWNERLQTNQQRTHTNAAAAQVFFLDLDVGSDTNKFTSKADAFEALKNFCKTTGLPKPLMISSGRGYHVYWLLSDPLPSEQWLDHATQLRQLTAHHGLKADTTRITDRASLLRVVGSFNLKDPANPLAVERASDGPVTATGVFCKLIHDALIVAGQTPKLAPKLIEAESLLGSNLDKVYDGPVPTGSAVLKACKQMERLALAKGVFSEPEWYHSVIGVGRFMVDGHRRIHQMSLGHKGYSEASCNAKIKQSEERQSGPSSCATVAFHSTVGDSLCLDCPFADKGSPVRAGLHMDILPPPVIIEQVGDQTITTTIRNPPPPFDRDKTGVSILTKDAAGDPIKQTIYDYDLYPVRRLTNPSQGIEQQVWHVELPRGEAKDFTLDADMIYDSRKFILAITHQGIYPNKGHISHLQEYMVAYISQLQKLVDSDAQCNHLGWADDYTQFIFPDKILLLDGTVKPVQLSTGAQRASAFIMRKGSLQEQVRLMRFFDHHAYLPNQVTILAALAAPWFYATGHHGVIVNASGAAGASKSTTLYAAASLFGTPELYPINGTNNGATVKGRNERVTVLANFPILVDEITHMPVKDAIDLAMSITQPGHRIRLSSDGVERASLQSHKATIMLTTANNSLHGILSTDNSAGTAGSMRVFEIMYHAQQVHQKHEADEFLHQLKQNYGHIGEVFMMHCMPRKAEVETRIRAKMREVDLAVGIQSSERFWSAFIAVVLVMAELSQEFGLLNYDERDLKRYLLEVQVPYMRGVVGEEYSDPLAVVMDYLETINSNMIVTIKMAHGNLGDDPVRRPSGPLFAHYDMSEQLLFVNKKHFKDHCTRIGANPLKVLDDLADSSRGKPIVGAKHIKRTLGSGTNFAKGQTWCFVINTAHPDVSGRLDLEVVTGGSPGGGSSSKANLQVVT